MADPLLINSTVIASIGQASGELVNLAQILAGGFVGLYIISIVLSYLYNRKMVKLLKEIKEELGKRKR
jgi:uncharacterized membrane protein